MGRAITGLLAAGLLTATALTTAPVGATPSDRGEEARSEHQRVVEFWTAERRAEARPADIVLPAPNAKPDGAGNGKGNGGGGGGDDGGDGGGGTTTVTGAKWTQGGAVAQTTGKVFFQNGSWTYVCSGSAIRSSSERLVLTAGHCVHDGGTSGGFHTNWIFYPGYDNGPGPLGGWTATDLFTTTVWATTQHGFNDDAGFAVVTNGSSTTTLEDALGSTTTIPTVAFGQTSDVIYASFGYPAAQKYKGGELIWCQGPVTETLDGYDSLAMACDMTGGSSGGPWFRDSPSGLTTVNSVNSYGYSSLKGYMFGPIFGSGESAAFSAATDGSCDTSDQNCTSSP